MVEMITNYQLMQGLIRLFTLDPLLAFSPLKVCVFVCVLEGEAWWCTCTCMCAWHNVCAHVLI